MIEILRKMTPAERLRRSFELRETTLELARQRIRKWHPNIDEHELRMRLFSLWLDADTMRRVYGWDPKEKGY